jgi:hypothetical protein
VVLVLVLVLVPPRRPPANAAAPSTSQTGATGLPGTGPRSAGTNLPSSAALSRRTGSGLAGVSAPRTATGASSTAAPNGVRLGTAQAAPTGTTGGSGESLAPLGSGVAITGVRCGPGVRQFGWSRYAPPCVPAFHGNNGGATAPGVTATTITLTYALANTAQQQAIDSLAGAANFHQRAYVADLETYIRFFNTQFELYGRHVVLKPFQAQGDYIAEDQGQDLGAAQADAVTAKDLGAFGDVTFSLTASEFYEQDLAATCGVHFAEVVAYSINVAEYENQAVSTVALMRAHGVTTVVCACDPIFPILLTDAAAQQGYEPEWLATNFGDPVGRDYNQTEWSHAISGGIQFPPLTSTEAYRAFELAAPGQHPAEWEPNSPPYFYVAYYTLMQVFDALQQAGPDLTPQTFERAMFSLPSSEPGGVVGGQWTFGQDVFDPISSFGIVWWSPSARSDLDGGTGAWQWCNGGRIYDVADLAALGGPHRQLRCFNSTSS